MNCEVETTNALVKTAGAKTTHKNKKSYGRLLAVNCTVKYLGLWIDENPNFDIHLKFVERKIACAVGIISKLQ